MTSDPLLTMRMPFERPRNDLPGLRNFARVAPGLYRGGQPTAEGFATLQALGIRTVLNLRAYHGDARRLRGTGLNYLHFRLRAWLPRRTHIARFLQVVQDPALQPVYLHCLHGSDRTGLCIAAYRVMVEGRSTDEALAELREFGFHRIFHRVPRFLRQLDAPGIQRRQAAARIPKVRLMR